MCHLSSVLPHRRLYGAILLLVMWGLVGPMVSPAAAATTGQLTATWTDTAADFDGFKIERKTGAAGTFALIATTGATTFVYVDAGLPVGTTYCYRVRAFNAVGDSPPTPEVCASVATPLLYTLTVAKTGTGTVASSPSGIDCGTTCTASFRGGTSLALSAAPASGFTFTGWSGACTGTSATCNVTMSQARSVTATFTAATAPLAITSFSANKKGSQPVGTAITFTLTGSGGVAPYQSKWWIWNGSAWSLGRDWATGNTYTWTPTAAGNYSIQVWLRNSGTATDVAEAFNGLAATIVPAGTSPLSLTNFTANKAGSQPVGTAITFTVTGTGGVAPYQFKWWIWNGSTWSLGRDWATGSTFTWTPTATGTYSIQVWARNNGAPADVPDAYSTLPATITP